MHNRKRRKKQLPNFYNQPYFFSRFCEGIEEFQIGRLSPVKKKEVDYAKLKKGDKVLDIGCGRGEVLLACAKKGASPYGIDFSKDAVNLTKITLGKYLQAGKIVQTNAQKLPFDNNTFDKCICGDVIEHMTFSQAYNCLQEAYRVLKPNGILVVHTAPNTFFTSLTYPLVVTFLKLIGKQSIATRLTETVKSTDKYHVDEYNFFNFRKIINSAFKGNNKIWIDRDILRKNSNSYQAELKRSLLYKLSISFLSRPPLLYFFGNDFYAICKKLKVEN